MTEFILSAFNKIDWDTLQILLTHLLELTIACAIIGLILFIIGGLFILAITLLDGPF